jgi:hypothetical protein
MSRSTLVPAPILRLVKGVAAGYSGSHAAERIIEAAIQRLGGEITVLDASGFHELFRVGAEGHGHIGVHVHETYIQRDTWKLRPATEAHPLHGREDYNYYVGKLLQALETGQYRKKEANDKTVISLEHLPDWPLYSRCRTICPWKFRRRIVERIPGEQNLSGDILYGVMMPRGNVLKRPASHPPQPAQHLPIA